jgi:hypothetical protein
MSHRIGFRYDEIMPGYPMNIRLFLKSHPEVEYPLNIDSPTERQAVLAALEEGHKAMEIYDQIKRLVCP